MGITVVTKNINKTLGGQSEGATLFHRDRNQLKRIGKPYKSVSIIYKYGELINILFNNLFTFANGILSNWTKYADPAQGNPPIVSEAADGGAMIKYNGPTNGVAQSTRIYQEINVLQGELYDFSITYKNIASRGAKFNLVLTTVPYDTYALQNLEISGSGTFDATWYNGFLGGVKSSNLKDNDVSYPYPLYFSADSECTVNLKLAPMPESGVLRIELYAPYRFESGFYYPPNPSYQSVTYKRVNMKRRGTEGAANGEKHTVVQDGTFTFKPDDVTVLNGDGEQKYVGTIFKDNLTTPTELWNRAGISENDSIMIAEDPIIASSKSFLRIATEEIARMYALPYIQFEGSIFGYFNYLSRFAINDVDGVFMPTSLTYELQNSLVSANFSAVSDADVDGIYSLTPVYDNVTKVIVAG
jgi:hypothetical protein